MNQGSKPPKKPRSSGSRLGNMHISPVKKRVTVKERQKATSYAAEAQKNRLAAKFQSLLKASCPGTTLDDGTEGGGVLPMLPMSDVNGNVIAPTAQSAPETSTATSNGSNDPPPEKQAPNRRKGPQTLQTILKREKENIRWNRNLPLLAQAYLTWSSGRKRCPKPPLHGKEGAIHLEQQTPCEGRCKGFKDKRILCLLFDRYEYIRFTHCKCNPISKVLVSHGFFPSGPAQPHIAVDMDLLDYFESLFEASCIADTALASSLNDFYQKRGYVLTHANDKTKIMNDPFRKSLARARQWYSLMHRYINNQVEGVLANAERYLRSLKLESPESAAHSDVTDSSAAAVKVGDAPSPTSEPTCAAPDESANTSEATQGECARFLRNLCPGCFGGRNFGRKFEEGCDIHVAADANFSQRHLRSVGTCSPFFDRQHLIPKHEVDEMGATIESVRMSRPPKPREPKVPDEAIDNCESTHKAGNGANVKTNTEHFDDTGVAALICRHGIPIFITNLDTAGEQQKYALAMVKRLFSLLPPKATVVVLYDVGCVVNRSLELYDILPASITSRLQWATSAMHAYAHQWSCQLAYNPRFLPGLALSDGEQVERYWSDGRKLIVLTRTSLGERRLYLLELQAAASAKVYRMDLGAWIRRRLKTGIPSHEEDGRKALEGCTLTIPQLREQWELQKEAQLSLRAHAPQRLKRELDSVLRIQSHLDLLDECIESARKELATGHGTATASTMAAFEDMQGRFKQRADALYESLNIQDLFPELKGLNINFVRKLLLLRDLKINIRKRAVGNFFEWERLNQAAGGRHQTLGKCVAYISTLHRAYLRHTGTKMHQQIRDTLSKRTPALTSAVRLFNRYCAELKAMYQKQWNIVLPTPLSEDLTELRNDPTLMEDVWITASEDGIPPWLGDVSVRSGIRGMLRLDRAREERQRIGQEADNMCRWFGLELQTLDEAILNADNSMYVDLLQERRLMHIGLKHRWATPLVSEVRYDTHVASSKLGPPRHYIFIEPITPNVEQAVDGTSRAGGEGDDSDDELEAEDDPDLAEEDTIGAEDNSGGTRDPDDAEVALLETLSVKPTDEEGTMFQYPRAPPVRLLWGDVSGAAYDVNILRDLEPPPAFHSTYDGTSGRALYLYGLPRPTYQFTRQELSMVRHRQMLNDEAVNGVAALMYHTVIPNHSSRNTIAGCALFTSHDILMGTYPCSPSDLWRRTKVTKYWEKSVWIIPINRPEEQHWVCAVVYPSQRRLALFDSFGKRAGWDQNIETVITFTARLAHVARTHGYDLAPCASDQEWLATPITTIPVQTNGVDCGVWVIAFIASLLRGYHIPQLTENEMPAFRRFLFQHMLRLPLLTV